MLIPEYLLRILTFQFQKYASDTQSFQELDLQVLAILR